MTKSLYNAEYSKLLSEQQEKIVMTKSLYNEGVDIRPENLKIETLTFINGKELSFYTYSEILDLIEIQEKHYNKFFERVGKDIQVNIDISDVYLDNKNKLLSCLQELYEMKKDD